MGIAGGIGVVRGRFAGRGAAIGMGSSLPVAGVLGGCVTRKVDWRPRGMEGSASRCRLTEMGRKCGSGLCTIEDGS